ncbi:MAG: alpha/beta hydrolase [Gemmatimonadota bacterium]
MLVGIVALGVLAGAVYERAMRREVLRRFPPAGKMVDVGGRRMQLDCRGTGSPTVVLEAGLDGMGSLSWGTVHDSLAASTRTCARSRAGVMWSEPAPGPFDLRRSMEDLHTALVTAGERPPWVMVGHSIAGPYLLEFTRLYPGEVAGLVLVDPSHPNQMERFEKVTGMPMPSLGAMPRLMSALSWTGLTRLMTRAAQDAGPVQRAINAYAPTSIRDVIAERRAMSRSMALVADMRDLGDRPLIVLTAMAPLPDATLRTLGITREQAAAWRAEWKALHDEEASWSTRGRNELVENASHYIHRDRPTVVIDAVREVTQAARGDPTGVGAGASRDMGSVTPLMGRAEPKR